MDLPGPGVEDARGAAVAWQYNARKQVVAQTYPLGFVTSLVRNGAGYVIRAVSALGGGTDYDRDLVGRVVAIRDADGGVRSFDYGCCDLATRTDALGTMSYEYSARHEMTRAVSLDGTVEYTYGWDPRGLLASASLASPPGPLVTYAFAYDAAGRRTQVTAGHLGPRTATYVLDPEGNTTQVSTNLNPSPLTYAYDGRNLPVSATAGQAPLVADVSYTPRRLVSQIVYSSGVAAAYGYNPVGQLTSVHYQGVDFAADYTAGYDASGNRTAVIANLPLIGAHNLQVDYDLGGLPATVNQLPGGLLSIAYNAGRDRSQLTGPGGTVLYGYTPAQRMVTAGPTVLQWNPAGGCTQVSAPGGVTSYAYRADGVLKVVTQGAQAWQVLVGPLGEVARVTLPGGGERWYALDLGRDGLLQREILPTPGAQAMDGYVYVPGLGERAEAPPPVGESAAPVMWLRNPAVGPNRRATLVDVWGSVTVVADGGGSVMHARAYHLFGEVAAQSSLLHVAQAYLGMDAVEGLAGGYGLGLSAGLAGAAFHDPFEAGAAAVRPYFPETGSFLYDVGFGPDGLFGQEEPLTPDMLVQRQKRARPAPPAPRRQEPPPSLIPADVPYFFEPARPRSGDVPETFPRVPWKWWKFWKRRYIDASGLPELGAFTPPTIPEPNPPPGPGWVWEGPAGWVWVRGGSRIPY